MTEFLFSPAPKPGGGYTTRAVFGDLLAEAALTTAAATAAGVTATQVETVIKTVLQGILSAAAGSGYAIDLYGLLRFRPTSGGSSEAVDGFNTPDDINADIALSFTAPAIAAWRAGLTLGNQGLVGKLTPQIDTIVNLKNGHDNEYSAGDMLELRGHLLRFDKSDSNQGVTFIKEDGSKVAATVYGSNTPSKVQALVPSALTGPVTVCLMAFINGSVRCFTYTDPITPSA